MNKTNVFKDYNIDIISKEKLNNDDIILIQQYFSHSDLARKEELDYCLKSNINSGYFNKIILLNEKIYTKEEMNLNDEEYNKVFQINIHKRLEYCDVIKFILKNKTNSNSNTNLNESVNICLDGYIIMCNSDIIFDESILYLRNTSLSVKKGFYSLLTYDIQSKNDLNNLEKAIPRKKKIRTKKNNRLKCMLLLADWSQDTWIFHTNFINNDFETQKLINETNFTFGFMRCDNKISYVFKDCGFIVYNMFRLIKTFHYHLSNIRNYNRNDGLPKPWLYIEPIDKTFEDLINLDK